MNTIEFAKKRHIDNNQFPMLVYPKKQKWDGKDIKSLKSISVPNIEELQKIKGDVFLNWKDLLKKPKAKTKQKA